MTKLPRTLHIESSGLSSSQDPDVMQFDKLAGEFLVVEEKLDGTGVSIFFDHNCDPQIAHRGSPATGKEFSKLQVWVEQHEDMLFDILGDRYILFGEWMLHKHTIFYDQLPAYFFESDIYDCKSGIFLSTIARHSMLTGYSDYIRQVPVIASLKPDSLNQITSLVGKPLYQSNEWCTALSEKCKRMHQPFDTVLNQTDQSGLAEGLYIKHEGDRNVKGRYKYVRREFIKLIVNSGSHLRDRESVHNILHGGL